MDKLSPEVLTNHVLKTVSSPAVAWVLFANGSFIVLESDAAENELREQALEIIKQYGPVSPGTASADFEVSALQHTGGWAVSSHGEGLFTYVHPSEVEGPHATDLEVGLTGRAKRDADSREREIIYVHTKAGADGQSAQP